LRCNVITLLKHCISEFPISGPARPQGRQPAAVFNPLGYSMPYGPGSHHSFHFGFYISPHFDLLVKVVDPEKRGEAQAGRRAQAFGMGC
jgi:hypothetical protein